MTDIDRSASSPLHDDAFAHGPPAGHGAGERSGRRDAGPGGRLFGLALATLLIAAIGFVVAYAAALLVVKGGLGGPTLFIGAPLVVVLGIAWTSGQAPVPRSQRLVELVASAALAVVLGVLCRGMAADLVRKDSRVVDVELRGDDASVALETRSRMTEMPGAGVVLAMTTFMASGSLALAALGGLLRDRPKRAF